MTELQLPFTIFVDGDPAPKGSVERNRTRGVRHTKRSKDWHATQVDAIKRQLCRGILDPRPESEPLTCDVAVSAEFVLRQPASNVSDAPDAKRHGDIDKHARSLLDALVGGGVIVDDSLVTELHVTKRWAGPTERCGVQVTVTWPTSEVMREVMASYEREFEARWDQLGIVPMREPRGLLNIEGISPVPSAVAAELRSYENMMRSRETMLAHRAPSDLTRIDIGETNEAGERG